MLLDELGPRAWWLLLVGLLSAAAVAVGIERSAVPVLARPAGWTGRVGGRGRRSEATLSSADSRHIRAAAEVEASVASGPSLPPDCGVPKSVPKHGSRASDRSSSDSDSSGSDSSDDSPLSAHQRRRKLEELEAAERARMRADVERDERKRRKREKKKKRKRERRREKKRHK